MKNLCVIFVVLIALILPIGGCVASGGNSWQNNIPRLKADIFMFSKLATRVALSEAKMQASDVRLVEEYLVALKDLLAVPGQPNFEGAKMLVKIKLPPKYKVYGLTIVDVIDRYLQSVNLSVTEDQEAIIGLISSGIDGAIVAVREFAM